MTAQCRPCRIAKYRGQIDQRARLQKQLPATRSAISPPPTRTVIEFLAELIRADLKQMSFRAPPGRCVFLGSYEKYEPI